MLPKLIVFFIKVILYHLQIDKLIDSKEEMFNAFKLYSFTL